MSKSPLTEVNKPRSARPQKGWVNPLFRNKETYKGPDKPFKEDSGWTLMDKVRKIVGSDDFRIFGENKWAGGTGLTHEEYFEKYGEYHNTYKINEHTSSGPGPEGKTNGDPYANIDKTKLLQPEGDDWEYLQNDDGTY